MNAPLSTFGHDGHAVGAIKQPGGHVLVGRGAQFLEHLRGGDQTRVLAALGQRRAGGQQQMTAERTAAPAAAKTDSCSDPLKWWRLMQAAMIRQNQKEIKPCKMLASSVYSGSVPGVTPCTRRSRKSS